MPHHEFEKSLCRTSVLSDTFCSLFLTNATLKIGFQAMRKMPFRRLAAALPCTFPHVNKVKRCPDAAARRIFQQYFYSFHSAYSSYNSYISH